MKKFLCLFAALCLILCLTGCASAADSERDYPADEFANGATTTTSQKYSANEDTSDTAQVTLQENRKLIKKIRMGVETVGYDQYVASLRTAVEEAGGYIQSFEEKEKDNSLSFSSFVIRIPADKTDAFLNVAGTGVTVTSRSEDVNDVTGEYVDISARMNALKAEEKSLLALLDKAGNVAEILTVRDRLSEVRVEIEAYQARLNSYDDLSAMSTIDLTVKQVPREKEKETLLNRIGNNFADAGSNIGGFFVNAFVFLLAALPYAVIISVPGIVVLIIIKKKRKNK